MKASATNTRNLRTLLLLNVFEPEEIGDRIKRARERAGLRQEDLADLIGTSTRQVQNYEAGATKQYSKLRQIAEATGCQVEDLLHGEGWATPDEGRLDQVLEAVEGLQADVREIRRLVEALREAPARDAQAASRRR